VAKYPKKMKIKLVLSKSFVLDKVCGNRQTRIAQKKALGRGQERPGEYRRSGS
jgi:hypothetical protein